MRYLILLFAAAASVLSTAPAHADLRDELAKLLAGDGEVEDSFGYSVAISGATAIVGALGDDDNGTNSGSAYLFDTSDPANPTQIAKLLPSDGAENNWFGCSVAISDTIAIIGALVDDDNGAQSGSAYLFDTSDPTNPTQIAKLLPSDGAEGDHFGWSVAISGATAIVGSPNDDGDNGTDSGSAYFFDTTTGQQLFKLLPNDGAMCDYFGMSVAISGKTAVVGAPDGDGSGSAYLFDATTGQQVAKLLASDGETWDQFGRSVGISGATAIVGACWDGDNGTNSGSAYLFDISDPANPTQLFKLLPGDGAEFDHFGYSSAISGTTATVGAQSDDDNGFNSGSAYVFDVTTGQQSAKLLPSDGAESDMFGNFVAISGTIAIAGSHRDGDNGIDSGSAYLFDASVATPCPGDLDGDGDVDQNDLGILLACYSINDGGDCDGDGDTDLNDLGILLAMYGLPCP